MLAVAKELNRVAEDQKFLGSTYPSSSGYLADFPQLRRLYRNSPIPIEEAVGQFELYGTPPSLRGFVDFEKMPYPRGRSERRGPPWLLRSVRLHL